MGSVKDLQILKRPEGNKLGLGRFNFSDRYSVFDWGEMPDLIEGKGASLCMTSAYFFEKLEGEGIGSHFVGVVEDGKAKRLADLTSPQSIMEIRLVRVIRPDICHSRPLSWSRVNSIGNAGFFLDLNESGFPFAPYSAYCLSARPNKAVPTGNRREYPLK